MTDVTIPISELSTDQAVRLLVRTTIPSLEEQIMALNTAVARLTDEVATQMQQMADALAAAQEALNNLAVSEDERTALQSALDEAVSANTTAADAINAQADILASDNPEAEEPTDPEAPVDPEEPVNP